MPLIILSGYPCAGLTYRAHQLSSSLDAIQSSSDPQDPDKPSRPYKIHVVGSHDNNDGAHPRTVYDTARLEKEARAVVYGRVKRLLGRDSIVIVDGMNYIKGWRYQLWCEAKSAGTTCCVVHVGTPVDQCVANNEARLRRKADARQQSSSASQPGSEPTEATEPQTTQTPNDNDDEDPYPSELLSNLIFRYEEPSTASRWDKPLFTVPWPDDAPPTDDIWSAITGSQRKPTSSASAISNLVNQSSSDKPATTAAPPSETSSPQTNTASPSGAGTGAGAGTFTRRPRPKIVPHQATQQSVASAPNTLYALEKRTSEIIAAIRTFTLANPTAPPPPADLTETMNADDDLKIPLPHTSSPLSISRATLASAPTDELAGAGGVLALPRLQRLRRQWIGLNRAVVGRQGAAVGPEQAGDAFVRFLNAEIEGVEVGVGGDGNT